MEKQLYPLLYIFTKWTFHLSSVLDSKSQKFANRIFLFYLGGKLAYTKTPHVTNTDVTMVKAVIRYFPPT